MVAEIVRLFKIAAASWWADRALSLGAAISYYTLFSLAPMLLAVIAVAALVFGREAAQGAVVAEIGGLIGQKEAAAIQDMIVSAAKRDSGILGSVIGITVTLFLATTAIVELQDSLNLIWKAKTPPFSGVLMFIRTRILSLTLLLGFSFLLLVSLVIDAALSAAGAYLSAAFSGLDVVLVVLNYLFSFAISMALFAMIFKILPDVPLTYRDVWMGAFVTALLFSIGKFAIGLYIGQSNLASSYGAAASIITVLVWVYYSSQILLFGAEFTKAFAEIYGSRREVPPGEAPKPDAS